MDPFDELPRCITCRLVVPACVCRDPNKLSRRLAQIRRESWPDWMGVPNDPDFVFRYGPKSGLPIGGMKAPPTSPHIPAASPASATPTR